MRANTTIRGSLVSHQSRLLWFYFSALILLATEGWWLEFAAGERLWRRKDGNPHSRSIHILNQSGAKIDIFWVHITSGKLAHSNTEGKGVIYGGSSDISSYVGHTFELQEMIDPRTHKCRRDKCRTARFTVTDHEDQVFTLWKNFTVTVVDHYTKALDKAKTTVEDCLMDPSALMALDATAAEEEIARLSNCVDERVKMALQEAEEEIAFQASVRMDMGQDLTKYVCLDEANATLSESLSNLTWKYRSPSTRMDKQYNIQVLFDASDGSTTTLIENFISSSQCRALQAQSLPSSTDHLGDEHPFGTTRTVPDAAKASLDVVEVLFKIQAYVKSTLDINLSYLGRDELFTQYVLTSSSSQRQRHPTACSGRTTTDEGGQETVTDATDGDEGECYFADALADKELNRKGDSFEMLVVPPTASATVILFCPSTGGAVHFPRTGVHIPATQAAGRALFIVHQQEDNSFEEDDDEGNTVGDFYMGEFALCYPQEPGSSMDIFVDSFTL